MRTNLILAIVAAGLAVPPTYTLLAEGIRFTRYDSIPLLFEGFNPETVAYVVLQQAKKGDDGKPVVGEDGKPALDRLVLAKDGDAWTVAEGPLAGLPVRPNAPEDVATKILDHVKRIRRDADKLILAQAKDEELAERNLTEATGMTVHCLTLEQKPVAQLIVGKDASGGK